MTRSSFPPPRGEIATSPARHLGHEEAAIFETFVVPRYLSFFGERLVGMLAGGRDARVCHVQCRTGYPDRLLVDRLPNVHVHGSDASPYAIELARAKAAALVKGDASVAFDYRVTDALPLAYPGGAFSHAFTIHPLAAPAERRLLLEELARIVAPRGQALIAMPLRGSFVEIADRPRVRASTSRDCLNAVEARCAGRRASCSKRARGRRVQYVDVDVRTPLERGERLLRGRSPACSSCPSSE